MQLATKQAGHSSNHRKLHLIMAAHSNEQGIIFCSCGFYLFSSFFFSFFFPRLISAVGDWMYHVYHTSTHDVALVRI